MRIRLGSMEGIVDSMAGIVDSMAGCLLLQERESLRISALRKNPGFSIGKVSKTRIFRLNADNLIN